MLNSPGGGWIDLEPTVTHHRSNESMFPTLKYVVEVCVCGK